MENCLAARNDDPFRGHGGPLVLERGPARGPLFDAFFAAVQEAGYPLTEDVNGYRQEGFAAFDRNVHDGRRLSAARAYLHPVKDRSNLDVKTFALTTKILFDGTRASGVEYSLPDRRTRQVKGGEVILCGGAINSPQLLQLSGVGAASELRGFGIPVVSDVPGVGENLQDHLEVYVQHSSRQPISMAPHFAMKNRPKVGAEWLLRKSGPGATNHFEAGGFIRGNEEVEYPNLMYHFLPIAVRYDGTLPPGGGGHGYQVHVGPMYSDVRGTCKITSTDPRKHPALRFNYLSTENDRKEWIEAIRATRKILAAAGLEGHRRRRASPGAEVDSDKQIIDWVAKDAETALHPSCTCRMGIDDMAVTDPKSLRVRGVDGLRVVDASVFPYVTNGNIYAPVMMAAEKACDLILGNTPLAAEPVEFYRHRKAERRGGGRGAGPHRPLHVAAHPLVRAADVEGRLVRPVQGSHGHHVTRPPRGDVAARPGIGAPAPQEERLQLARPLAERRHHLLEQGPLQLLLRRGQERAEALRRHERGHDPLALGPGAADQAGLRVDVAVLTLSLPERVRPHEHRLGHQRVLLAPQRVHPLA